MHHATCGRHNPVEKANRSSILESLTVGVCPAERPPKLGYRHDRLILAGRALIMYASGGLLAAVSAGRVARCPFYRSVSEYAAAIVDSIIIDDCRWR